MVIKPHLAVAFAVYSILSRRRIAVVAAATVVVASSLICTAVFGFQIWTAFIQSVRDSAVFLEEGFYPLFRMVSSYAALRTAGLPGWAAFLGQAAGAALMLGLVAVAVYRKFPTRWTLGLAAMASLSISPYAYDYDFLIFGIGLMLVLPELKKVASEGERAFIYITPMIVGAYGILQSYRLASAAPSDDYLNVISIGGFALLALIPFIFRFLFRGSKPRPVQNFAMQAE